MPSACEPRPAPRRTSRNCSAVYDCSHSVSPSATDRWVKMPSTARCRAGAASALTKSTASSGKMPSRPMPVSTLTWTRAGRSSASAARESAAGHLQAVDGRASARGAGHRAPARPACSRGPARARRMPACRSATPFAQRCHAQPGRAVEQRGLRHLHRAVPVGVRLQRDQQLPAAGQLHQPAHVVGDGAVVDLQPGRAGRGRA